MAENKNTYQVLAELIHQSPKLLGSGGLFGGLNENHAVFALFAAYVKKEKERYNKIPETIGIDNFINYLISDSGKSQEEISEIEKKLDHLKKQGDIRDDSSRDVGKNTLYQFAVVLDELGVEGNVNQLTGIYNQALKNSLQAAGTAESGEAGRPVGVTQAKKPESGVEAKIEEPEEPEKAERTQTETEAKISEEENIEAQVSARIKSAATQAQITPAEESVPKSPETQVSPPARPSQTIPIPAETSASPIQTPSLDQTSTRLPTISTETVATLSPLTPGGPLPVRTFGGPRGLIFTGGVPQTRKKIRLQPLRSIQILGGEPGTRRTAAPERVSAQQTAQQTAEAQLQALQQSQAASGKTGGATTRRPGKKRKSLAVRLAKYTAAGAGSVPFLPLLGGSSAEAFTGTAGTFGVFTATVNFLLNLLF